LALASREPLRHLLDHSRVKGISSLGHREPLCTVQAPDGFLILGWADPLVDEVLWILALDAPLALEHDVEV